ncbi:MAG: Hypoxanthine-guanine phosphoribosyltransferase, partial [Planctomycetota bacterium]
MATRSIFESDEKGQREIVKVLLSEQQLEEGVAAMAKQITHCYGDRPLTVIAIMTGAIMLLADLIRQLEMPLRVGLIQASSYRGGTSSGDLTLNDSMMLDIRDRDVLLIDDIFDTGKTLSEVMAKMIEFQPKSLRAAVLLNKVGRQQVDMQPDFVGFNIPDEFVVGYGLDYQDHYRNLPYVA